MRVQLGRSQGPRRRPKAWSNFENLRLRQASLFQMKKTDRLDALRIITPCTVPWSSMKGDEQVRFCGQCRKNVYDVSAMTRSAALSLIERAEGRVCMQIARRPDGTIATGDCWAPLRRARRRGILALAAALPIVLAAQLWSQAFGLRALGALFHRAPAPSAALAPTRGEVTLVTKPGPGSWKTGAGAPGEVATESPPPAPVAPMTGERLVVTRGLFDLVERRR
jgi:hypothetical protein